MERAHRVLHVVNYFDPAGDVIRCFNELKKYSRHSHELFVKDRHPLQASYGYEEAALMAWNTVSPSFNVPPKDLNERQLLAWRAEAEKREKAACSAEANAPFRQAAEWCDCVLYHFVGPESGFRVDGKPAAFRNVNIYWSDAENRFWSAEEYNARSLDGFRLVSSSHVGAQEFLPGEFRWLPDLIPIFDVLYAPEFSERPPCVSYIKHGNDFDIADFGAGVGKQRLDRNRHAVILASRRVSASVVIDNVSDGHYGLAGLEAMSQGFPAIMFNREKTRAALRELAPLYPPLMEVGPSLYEAIQAARSLLAIPAEKMLALRREMREWMVTHYNSKRLIAKYWDTFVDELMR